MTAIALASALSLASASLSAGAESFEDHDESAPDRVSVLSKSRRFVVSGEDRGACLTWAIWAENTSTQIASLLGDPIPDINAPPMVIRLFRSEESEIEAVRIDEEYSDSMLHQRMYVDLDRSDEIDLLRSFSKSLCNRYAIALQSNSERSFRLAQTPEWLSVGLAAKLSRVYRDQLRREARVLWISQAFPSIDEILALEAGFDDLSEAELTACYVFIRWLRHIHAFQDVAQQVFAESARHGRVAAGDIIDAARNLDGRRDLQMRWELYIASLDGVDPISSRPESADILRRLRSLFEEIPAQYEVLAGQSLRLDDLTAFRGQSWMQDLAGRIEIELQLLIIQSDSEISPLIQEYIEAFRHLGRAPGGFWSRLGNQGKSNRWIADRLASLSEEMDRHSLLLQDSDSDLDTDS